MPADWCNCMNLLTMCREFWNQVRLRIADFVTRTLPDCRCAHGSRPCLAFSVHDPQSRRTILAMAVWTKNLSQAVRHHVSAVKPFDGFGRRDNPFRIQAPHFPPHCQALILRVSAESVGRVARIDQ